MCLLTKVHEEQELHESIKLSVEADPSPENIHINIAAVQQVLVNETEHDFTNLKELLTKLVYKYRGALLKIWRTLPPEQRERHLICLQQTPSPGIAGHEEVLAKLSK